MPSFNDVQSALTQSIITLNNSELGALPVAYEGRSFDPSDVDLYIEPVTLFGDRVSLSKKTLDEILGVYQITIRQKSGLEIAPALTACGKILAEYRHNTSYVYNGQKVVIINSTRNAGRTLDGWYTVNISINFKSDDARS